MIKTEKIDGLEVQYILVDPSRLDLEFSIGSTVKQLGSGHDAAINFAYADLETGTPIGRVVVDGITVISDSEKTKNRDLFYLTKTGTACIGPYPRTPIDWAIQGSPRLLMDGKNFINASIKRDSTASDITSRKAQRTAVGIRRDGTVVLLVTNDMMSLEDLANIMLRLECVDALNGDGGGSSYLWPEDTGWGRKVGAAIVVKKEVKKEEVQKSMRIVIDAGHGPETAGKRCPDDSMREFHFNSVVADYTIELLKGYEGVETLATYDKTRDVPLVDRTIKANNWKADAFVSIHANASGSGTTWDTAHGIETFTYTEPSKAAIALAVSVQRNLVQATGLDDRSVKKDNLHVLRETKMPAILVECGFMTNKKEAELLKSDDYRRKCANAIVKGIVECYGLKKKEEPVKMTTNPQTSSKLPTIQKAIEVSVNDGPKSTAYLIDNVTYVPIRMVSESLGATVDFNGGAPVKITKEVK